MRRFLVPSGGLLKPCGVTERHEMILVTEVDLNPRSALITRKLLILRYAKKAQLAETAILSYTFLTLPVLERATEQFFRTSLRFLPFHALVPHRFPLPQETTLIVSGLVALLKQAPGGCSAPTFTGGSSSCVYVARWSLASLIRSRCFFELSGDSRNRASSSRPFTSRPP